MYALPNNFDLQLLSGCYLEMVSFGPSVTKLDFARAQSGPGQSVYKVVFCIESKLSYQLNETSGSRDYSDTTTCAPLIGLLLENVVSVAVIDGVSIRINFNEGRSLMIEGDVDAEFESYSIYLNSGELIVV